MAGLEVRSAAETWRVQGRGGQVSEPCTLFPSRDTTEAASGGTGPSKDGLGSGLDSRRWPPDTGLVWENAPERSPHHSGL